MNHTDAYTICRRYVRGGLFYPSDKWQTNPWVIEGRMYATDGVFAARVSYDGPGSGVCLSPDYGPQVVEKDTAPLSLRSIFDTEGYTEAPEIRVAWNTACDRLKGLITPFKGRRRDDAAVTTVFDGTKLFSLAYQGYVSKSTNITVSAHRVLHIGKLPDGTKVLANVGTSALDSKYMHLLYPNGAHVVMARFR